MELNLIKLKDQKGKIMQKKHFPVALEQDKDGVFIVSCPLFKGCHSYGHTIDEAIENIIEAIACCYEEEADENQTQFLGIRDVEIAV